MSSTEYTIEQLNNTSIGITEVLQGKINLSEFEDNDLKAYLYIVLNIRSLNKDLVNLKVIKLDKCNLIVDTETRRFICVHKLVSFRYDHFDKRIVVGYSDLYTDIIVAGYSNMNRLGRYKHIVFNTKLKESLDFEGLLKRLPFFTESTTLTELTAFLVLSMTFALVALLTLKHIIN